MRRKWNGSCEVGDIVIKKGLRNRTKPLAFSNIQGWGSSWNRGANFSESYSQLSIVKHQISRMRHSFILSAMSTISRTRMRHVVTQNFNKANPSEELYNEIPKSKPRCCLVPALVHLLFDFNISNTKSCSTMILANCLRVCCDQACRRNCVR